MPELKGLPLCTHLDLIHHQLRIGEDVYGYPLRKVYRGFPGLDLSVDWFGKKAATPAGPAAGPHTQMAQNILLSYLAGGRVIECKTIQILDQIKISRPCIDMRNIGFNVEWSQELSLSDSLQEYLHAWILLHHSRDWEIFSDRQPIHDFVFDLSVGYDLEGITSAPVAKWLTDMRQAGDALSSAIDRLPARHRHLKKLSLPDRIADTVTLSTFHGCPTHEIKAIVQYLMDVHHMHVVVKMNPTILGYQTVKEILIDQLGYRHLRLDEATFQNDLSLDEAVELINQLQDYAQGRGVELGVKFTNTLLVKNTETIFANKVRYLSGAPLYVLAMQAVRQFRERVGLHLPISFSGGINKLNFAEALACNLIPVTSCTDLLKKGGYARLNGHLQSLAEIMETMEARTIDDFIIKTCNQEDITDRMQAGYKNLVGITADLRRNPFYSWQKNRGLPKKINSRLHLFDCLSCNICIPVCPNGAIFEYHSGRVNRMVTNYLFDGRQVQPIVRESFQIKKESQIGILAEWCNDCGNCQTFCPEQGAPCSDKSRFFLYATSYKSNTQLDGFYFPSTDELYARIENLEYHLSFDRAENTYQWKSPEAEFQFDREGTFIHFQATQAIQANHILSTTPFQIMRTIFDAFQKNDQSIPLTIIMESLSSKNG